MSSYRDLARALADDALEPGLGEHPGLALWSEYGLPHRAHVD
jgi:hypothetical protein